MFFFLELSSFLKKCFVSSNYIIMGGSYFFEVGLQVPTIQHSTRTFVVIDGFDQMLGMFRFWLLFLRVVNVINVDIGVVDDDRLVEGTYLDLR